MELTAEILEEAQKRATQRMAKETAEAGMPPFMRQLIGACIAHYAVRLAQELGTLPQGPLVSLREHISFACGTDLAEIEETIVSQADAAADEDTTE
jgi:hypothetical protein